MDGDAAGAPAGGSSPSPANTGSETSVASVHMGSLPDVKKRKKPVDEDEQDEMPRTRSLSDPYGGFARSERGTFAGIFSREF